MSTFDRLTSSSVDRPTLPFPLPTSTFAFLTTVTPLKQLFARFVGIRSFFPDSLYLALALAFLPSALHFFFFIFFFRRGTSRLSTPFPNGPTQPSRPILIRSGPHSFTTHTISISFSIQSFILAHTHPGIRRIPQYLSFPGHRTSKLDAAHRSSDLKRLPCQDWFLTEGQDTVSPRPHHQPL